MAEPRNETLLDKNAKSDDPSAASLMVRPTSTADLVNLQYEAPTPGGQNLAVYDMNIKVPKMAEFSLKGKVGNVSFETKKVIKRDALGQTPPKEGLSRPPAMSLLPTDKLFTQPSTESLIKTAASDSQPGLEPETVLVPEPQPLTVLEEEPGSPEKIAKAEKHEPALPHIPGVTDPLSQEGRFDKTIPRTSELPIPYQTGIVSPDNRFAARTEPTTFAGSIQETDLRAALPAEKNLLDPNQIDNEFYEFVDPIEPNLHTLDEETYNNLRKEAGNPYPEVFNRILSELLEPLAPIYKDVTGQVNKIIRIYNKDLEKLIPPEITRRESLSKELRDIFLPPFEKFNKKIQQVKQMCGSLASEEIGAIDEILRKAHQEFATELAKINYPNHERIIKASQEMVVGILAKKPLLQDLLAQRLVILQKSPQAFRERLQKQAEELEGLAKRLAESAQLLLNQFSQEQNKKEKEEEAPLLAEQKEGVPAITSHLPDSKKELASGIDADDWEAVKPDPEMEEIEQTIQSQLKNGSKESYREIAARLFNIGKTRTEKTQRILTTAKKRLEQAQETTAKLKQPTSFNFTESKEAQPTFHEECSCVGNHKDAILKLRPDIQDTDFEVVETDSEVTIKWNRDDEPPSQEVIDKELNCWCPKCVRDGLFLMLDPDTALSAEPGKAPEKSKKGNYAFAAFSSIFTAIFAFMGPSGKQPSELMEAWNDMNNSQRALAILYGFSSEAINTFLTADFSERAKKAFHTLVDACRNMFKDKAHFGYGLKNIGELLFGGSSALAALALGIDSLKWLKPLMAGKFDDAEDVAEGITILGGSINFFVTFVSRYIGLISLLDLIVNQFKIETTIKNDILSKLSRIDEKYLPNIEQFLQDKKLTEENIVEFLAFLDTLPQNAFREVNWVDRAKQLLDLVYGLGAITSSLCAWGVFGQKAINAMSLISDIKSKPAWAQGLASAFPGLPSLGLYASGFYKFHLYTSQRLAHLFQESTTPVRDFGKLLLQYFFPGVSSFSVGVMAKGVADQSDGYVHDTLSKETIKPVFTTAAQGGAVAVNTVPLIDPKGAVPLPTTWGKKDPKLPAVIRHIGVEGISTKAMSLKRPKVISFFRDMPKADPANTKPKKINVVRKP